jgi:NAD(P)-dependent dehydrogenase (short-subunit alcohol dehydrogenase family)
MKRHKTGSDESAWLGLAGQVCVVTGGGSGIGAGTARRFAAVGATVAILDRDRDGAESVASEIARGGGHAMGLEVDVTDIDAVTKAALQVSGELGACSVLVNNAAVQLAQPLMTLDIERWRRALDVNLTGAFACAQVFGAQMIAAASRRGSIVNIGSITGETPRPDGGAYSASKAGIAMLSRQLAVELGRHGIRSNTVAPGFVRTPLSERTYQDPAVARRREDMVPLGRIGDIGEIADVVMFLASIRAAYVTGQTIVVDGGLGQCLMGLVPRPRP